MNDFAQNTPDAASERRYQPRIPGHAPAFVRGLDAQGHNFEETAVLHNVSASGLFIQLARPVDLDHPLFIIFPFPTSGHFDASTTRVAVRGQIRRVEPWRDGVQGIGVHFRRYRLL